MCKDFCKDAHKLGVGNICINISYFHQHFVFAVTVSVFWRTSKGADRQYFDGSHTFTNILLAVDSILNGRLFLFPEYK